MASRQGPVVPGGDGSDFTHREKVANHYQISVRSKGYLRGWIFCHMLLGIVMVLKLVPAVLDRMNVFILAVEELEIPEPKGWELIWLCGCVSASVGLSAVKRNKYGYMQIYLVLVNVLGMVPVLVGMMSHLGDFIQYVTVGSAGIAKWRTYPLAVIWFAFLAVACQVHVACIYFSSRLLNVWADKRKA